METGIRYDCTTQEETTFDYEFTKEQLERKKAIDAQIFKEELRARRDYECFSVVNRGKLWYDTLAEEQLYDLNVWYHDWLDVTETLEIPIKPDFIT